MNLLYGQMCDFVVSSTDQVNGVGEEEKRVTQRPLFTCNTRFECVSIETINKPKVRRFLVTKIIPMKKFYILEIRLK